MTFEEVFRVPIPAKHALSYSRFFWPEMIAVDRFVFIREQYDATDYARLLAEHGPAKIEETINTVYIDSLVSGNLQLSEWEIFGTTLANVWAACAEKQFPGRSFEATFSWYSDASDPGVTLRQVSKPLQTSGKP